MSVPGPHRKLISVISPVFNEEANVEDCYRAVKAVFAERLADYDYEHIFCDNASTDRTLPLLEQLARQDTRVKVIANSRNFGVSRSAFNGLLSARGDAVVFTIAGDLQDPPTLIPDFVGKWLEGYQVVYGIRTKRRENWLLTGTRKLYYRLVQMFADFRIPADVGDFQLVDRAVVDALRKFEDYYPYTRGLIAQCGFQSTGIPYEHLARQKGAAKGRLLVLLDLGLNGLISFTKVPLRLMMLFGFLVSIASILFALVELILVLVLGRQAPPGIATLSVALFFFSGVQILFMGFLGEYIAAIHFQVRKRPLVIEKRRINFPDE